jgi:hypothetical protein
MTNLVAKQFAIITTDAFRPMPCENVREPRKRRTVFSIAFFG